MGIESSKICKECGKEKGITHFYLMHTRKDGSRGTSSKCKECSVAGASKWRRYQYYVVQGHGLKEKLQIRKENVSNG